MHVALVHRDLHRITRGGICTVYRSLAERFAARGHPVTLVTQETPHPLRIDGARVVTLPRTDDLDLHRDRVADALTAIRPDVVDASSWEAEILHHLGRPDHVPVVLRSDLSAATMGAADLAAAEEKVVHKADKVVAVSEYAAADLADKYRITRPQVVPNGVDRDRFTPGPAAWPRSGHQVSLNADGRVASRTSIHQILATGASVPPWTTDSAGRLRLVWVGKITPMKGWDRLEQLAARLDQLAQVTVLLGHAPAFCPVHPAMTGRLTILQDLDEDDLVSFYRAADYLLSTSRWEGFGLAIAEALACGTPVLLPAQLGTAPELLAAGGGLTYQTDDHLAELIASQPAVVGRLPTRFNWNTNADASLAVYRQLATR